MRLVLFFLAFAGCTGGPKDALDPTHHDVRTDDAGASNDGYAYIARRAFVALALAEARNIPDDEAKRILDRAADSAQGCFQKYAREGTLTQGAVRVIVPVDDGGIVGQPLIKFSASQGAAVQGMLCVVASLRMAGFSPTAPGGPQRALAIEAAWGTDLSAQQSGGSGAQ